jgi:hypothetical protein
MNTSAGCGTASQSVQLPRGIAQQWDAENKLHQVGIASVRQIYWNCGSCGEQFKKRVRDHVDDKGCCPFCVSAWASIAALASTTMTIKSPARPTSVDVSRHSRDKRMLSPMLAYSWDKYKDRIDPKDDLFVNDKLDGVRCIVACSPQSIADTNERLHSRRPFIPTDLVQNTAEYLGRVAGLLSFRGVSTEWQGAVSDAVGFLNGRCWNRLECHTHLSPVDRDELWTA